MGQLKLHGLFLGVKSEGAKTLAFSIALSPTFSCNGKNLELGGGGAGAKNNPMRSSINKWPMLFSYKI